MVNVPEISIVIVNYKTPKLLEACIRSIQDNKGELELEIIIVDNDSNDDSKSLITGLFSFIKWFDYGYNAGFARANNLGISKSQGDYVILLNSDTIILEDCLFRCLTYFKKLEMTNCNPGMLSCKLIGLNGELQFNSNSDNSSIFKALNANPLVIYMKRFLRKEANSNVKNRIDLHNTNHINKWIGATFAMFNRHLFKKNGLFLDEDFFMYSEDVEWCNRINKNGFKNHFYAESKILHVNFASSNNSDWRKGQITISEWLCIYKTKGYLYYKIYIFILKINLFFDVLLNNKKIKKKLCDSRKQIQKDLNFNTSLLKKYSRLIPQSYKTKPSSAKEMLIYDIKAS